MNSQLKKVQLINLPYDFADNGDLAVMEGQREVPFPIARVFVVRGLKGVIRGKHAHKYCTQFLTCPYGEVLVECDDGVEVKSFVLDRPQIGLLIPPGIWAQQTYLLANSVLTVLCDRPFEHEDYIRDYNLFKSYKISTFNY
jgi:dTDP-4-dehydrorhamnose 3,5-epimerase-like enzyme